MDQLKNDSLLGSNGAKHVEQLSLDRSDSHQILQIGSFYVDVDEMQVSDLVQMRKLLPRVEYKMLKNRKCSKLSRIKRKEENSEIIAQNK